MLLYHCNVPFWKIWRNTQIRQILAQLVMTLEGSNFHQMIPNLKGNSMVSIKTSKGGLWILFIKLYTSATLFGADNKKAKNY